VKAAGCSLRQHWRIGRQALLAKEQKAS